LVVSGQGDEARKVAALEAGADDYVTKPFGIAELIARMRVALRHQEARLVGEASPILQVGDVTIDRDSRRVCVRGETVHLTPIEYKLLVLLASHGGRVLTHRQILSQVWGEEYAEESTYLRVYMGYLRKKIEVEPAQPRLLLTEARIGYRLAV
jgi:two-component system KDP operon response regulator KdpE